MGYLKKRRFGTLYKALFPNLYMVLVSISLGGAPLDDCGLNIDFVLELEGPPSIHRINRIK